jgi:hypothetical protein
MADHTIAVNFKVDASHAGNLAKPEPLRWTQHFRNFAITPEGHIIIKNFSDEFRDRLAAVLNDESVPFTSILPVIPRF